MATTTAATLSKATANLREHQKRYNEDFDAHVRKELTPIRSYWVYMPKGKGDGSQYKLILRSYGPFQVVQVLTDNHTADIRRHSNEERFDVNRAALSCFEEQRDSPTGDNPLSTIYRRNLDTTSWTGSLTTHR